jgi:hypothetical protein
LKTLVALALGTIAVTAVSLSCDPVHSDEVSDLGPEANGVRTGPTHRPGQPCLVCHGGSGPGSPQWAVAGTVYLDEVGTSPLVGGTVTVTDATGSERALGTNEAGNFYISTDDWQPVYPLHVKLQSGNQTIQMNSRINGNGSCADCHLGHTGQATSNEVPAVYLNPVDGGAPP